ncbi:hypothetical protein [Desulfocurvibacter africanus]|uniref:hypothetical protein n=1 Tax=Desulfocurvibacter africanus TaxID=873 RepID=UPI0004862310|nr:hypothetical protein [Desulfocurvibacter africanus]
MSNDGIKLTKSDYWFIFLGLAFVSAFIYHFAYWNTFGINIYEYMSPSDVLISTLFPIMEASWLSIVLWLFLLFGVLPRLMSYNEQAISKTKQAKETAESMREVLTQCKQGEVRDCVRCHELEHHLDSTSNDVEKITKTRKFFYYLERAALYIMYAFIGFFLIGVWQFDSDLLLTFLSYFIFYGLVKMLYKSGRIQNFLESINIGFPIVIVIIMVLFSSFAWSRTAAFFVDKEYYYTKVTPELLDLKIESKTDEVPLIYLGKAGDYIFLRLAKDIVIKKWTPDMILRLQLCRSNELVKKKQENIIYRTFERIKHWTSYFRLREASQPTETALRTE